MFFTSFYEELVAVPNVYARKERSGLWHLSALQVINGVIRDGSRGRWGRDSSFARESQIIDDNIAYVISILSGRVGS